MYDTSDIRFLDGRGDVPPRCDCHRLAAVVGGRLRLRLGGDTFEAGEGDAAWQLPHSGLTLEADDGAEWIAAEFTTAELRAAFGGSAPTALLERAQLEPVFAQAAPVAELMMLREIAANPRHIYYKERMRAALALAVSSLTRGEAPPPRIPGMIERRHFARFERLVAQHGMAQHAVAWYAERLCLSPAYLSQVVRMATGGGALAYINNWIADRTAELLDTTNLTVQQIADAVGFADQATLSKFFKRHRGLNPSDWRSKGS